MTAIAPRIGKFIRLLASDQDGEVVGAARALQRTLKAAGRDLHWLADRADGADRREHDRREHWDPTHRPGTPWWHLRPRDRQELLERLLASRALTPWEWEFCGSILAQTCANPWEPLSPKQRAVLDRLVQKVGGAAS